MHGALGWSVAGAFGPSQALVAVPRHGAPLAGGEPFRYRRYDAARAGYDGAVFVITDVLFGSDYASAAAVFIAAFFLYAWFVVPIRYRLKGE